MSDNNIKSLPAGYILQGNDYNYEIKQVLGQGSFGITYLASMEVEVEGTLGKIKTSSPVTIKEFFMSELNGRNEASVTSGGESTLYNNYKRKFYREAESLSKLAHKNIVKVLEFFERNNTIYYVMEFLRNGSLNDIIEGKGRLTEQETINYSLQICEALKYMHSRQMLHLDLKPQNIMLNDKREAVLIDFGLSKHYDISGNPESSTTIGGGTPGYAPIEQSQYKQDGTFQATLDIYALGATMFKMLTGKRPNEASEILNDGFDDDLINKTGASQNIINIVKHAMAPLKKQRFQSVDEVLAELKGLGANNAAPVPPMPQYEDEKTQFGAPDNNFVDEKTEIIGAENNNANVAERPQPAKVEPQPVNIPKAEAPKKNKSNKAIAWVSFIIIFISVAGVGTYLLTSDDKGETNKPGTETSADNNAESATASMPEDVAKQFADAVSNGDVNLAYELCTSQRKKDLLIKDIKELSDLCIASNTRPYIGKISIDGESAVAELIIEYEGDKETLPMPLIKLDGVWKINFDLNPEEDGTTSDYSTPIEVTPDAVLQNFIDALLAEDIDTALSLVKSSGNEKAIREAVEGLSKLFASVKSLAKIHTGETTVNGNKATVEMVTESFGEKEVENIDLVKIDGTWKIKLD